MTANTTARDQALAKILRDAEIDNEDGEQIVDFTMRNIDSQDFASCLSRQQLQAMLFEAYYAGRNAK